MISDALILGAGGAGLCCAQVAAAAGKKVRVLERSRGVGGRCATRRIDGQPVDHGLVFLHGQSPDFLAALRAVPGPWREGWPTVIHGSGTPCQPAAFTPGAYRLAHAHGIGAVAKHWASGLDVALETRVVGLELREEGIAVLATQHDTPATFVGRDVVLAMAGPQGLALLASQGPPSKVETVRALLSMMPSVPCATVIALHPADALRPTWDVWYPESSSALLLLAHDSAKREPAARALGRATRDLARSHVAARAGEHRVRAGRAPVGRSGPGSPAGRRRGAVCLRWGRASRVAIG